MSKRSDEICRLFNQTHKLPDGLEEDFVLHVIFLFQVFIPSDSSCSMLQANVVGRRCGKCISGTFGLSVDNPSGCTSCYCFRRTTQCTQADLTWSQVRQTPGRGREGGEGGARGRCRGGVAGVLVAS